MQRGGQVEDVAVAERRQPAVRRRPTSTARRPWLSAATVARSEPAWSQAAATSSSWAASYDACAESGRGPH